MSELEMKFLLPGEFHATRKPMPLGILLSSRFSVRLHNVKQKFAAMIEFKTPTRP